MYASFTRVSGDALLLSRVVSRVPFTAEVDVFVMPVRLEEFEHRESAGLVDVIMSP